MAKAKSPTNVAIVGQGLAELVDDPASPFAVSLVFERPGQRAYAMTPDGAGVLLGAGRALRLEDSSTGATRHTFELREPPTLARFSPDGALLAIAEQAPRSALVLYDARGGRELARHERLPGMPEYAPSVPRFTFSADGARLAYVETFREDPLLWVLDREGRVERAVPLRGTYWDVTPSAAPGRALLVPARQHLPLLELDLATGELRSLLSTGIFLTGALACARGVVLSEGHGDLWLGSFESAPPARWPAREQLDRVAKGGLARLAANLEARAASAKNAESKSRLAELLSTARTRGKAGNPGPEGFARFAAGRWAGSLPQGVDLCAATEDRLVSCGRQELLLLSLEREEPHERELLRAASKREYRVALALLGAHGDRVLVQAEDGRNLDHAALVLSFSPRALAPAPEEAKKPAAKKPAAKKPAAKKPAAKKA